MARPWALLLSHWVPSMPPFIRWRMRTGTIARNCISTLRSEGDACTKRDITQPVTTFVLLRSGKFIQFGGSDEQFASEISDCVASRSYHGAAIRPESASTLETTF